MATKLSEVRDRLLKMNAGIKLRTKLFLLFFVLLMVTLLLSSYGYYTSSLDSAVEQHSKEAYQNIRQSSIILDQKLSSIVENSELMMKDKEIYRIFAAIDPNDPNDLLKYDRELKRIIAKYYTYDEQIYSSTIMTSYYSFGNGYVPYDGFKDSTLDRHIRQGGGELVWEPTFDFLEMFRQESLAGADISEFQFLFSSGRLLNLFDNSTGDIVSLPGEKEAPVLLLNFKLDFMRDYYKDLGFDEKRMFLVVAPSGQVVFDNTASPLVGDAAAAWIADLPLGQSGTMHAKDGADDLIVSYDTSEVTGWTLVSAIRDRDLIPEASRNIINTVARLGSVVLMISLVIAYVMSMLITKPLSQLITAIRKTGRGDFTSKLPVRGQGELDNVIRHFNDMNDKIQLLIHENYEAHLLEKQAQINRLNTQVNPHFLYNTLNLVSCIAIEQRSDEISRIVASLSRMLQYTVQNDKTTGTLQEELTWLEDYMFIMRCRFEERLDYACYVDGELVDREVPRLFLQPFIENAFVHAFEEMDKGCVLRITGWQEDDHLYFTVRDNGQGISAERVVQIISGEESGSVGMSNVHRRLKLMYGDRYGIEVQSTPGTGTTILIRLPA
ncbi:two-component sensor histidine kinase [Paenibacillus sp. 598K]|uniref:sensor histidine kinase n=1 Tax=Paenibacillus sp. 598K TaxID=1117987 RepID=UPI000FFA9EBB|nr:histidine kinase [Paenibacillus sp. 598K]GBF77720.1 two-component sensor histidine kinase [Paenibacillus sp. 598K]